MPGSVEQKESNRSPGKEPAEPARPTSNKFYPGKELTGCTFCHLNGGDSQRPQVTL